MNKNVPAATATADFEIIDEIYLPYIELDARGMVTRANRAALALHHGEYGELVGNLAWDIMATDEKDPSCAAYMSLMDSGEEPPMVERSLYTRAGAFRQYELHRSLIRDSEGQPAGMRIIGVDVTEAKKALETAQRAQQWLESLLGSVADAMLATDALGFIRFLNPAAEALLGWKAEELIGRAVEKGFPVLDYVSEDSGGLSFTKALEGESKGVATTLDRERRELKVEITTSPILYKGSGHVAGVVSVLRRVEGAH